MMNYNEGKKLINYAIGAVLLVVILYRLGSYLVYRFSDDYVEYQWKQCLEYVDDSFVIVKKYRKRDCLKIDMFYEKREFFNQKIREVREKEEKEEEAKAKKRKEEEEQSKRLHEIHVREVEELRKKVRDGTATEKEKQDLSTREFMLEIGF